MKKTFPRPKKSATPSRRIQLVALAALILATTAAAVMSARNLWAITLPGCGQAGGCEWATNGPYSKLFGFPIAFLGLGYFVASLCNLALSRRSFPDHVSIWLVRLGAVGSLVFVGIMLSYGRICLWCAFTHLGNLVYWGVAEQLARSVVSGSKLDYRNSVIATLIGLLTIAGLQLNRSRVATAKEADDYRKGMESVAKIGSDADTPVESTSTQSPVQTPPTQPQSSGDTKPEPARFGGRYWEGSSNPSVRIVVFHDYQCELCREVEAAIALLIARLSDVAFSVKQWPFDAGCNRFILGKNMHPGACEASKVAEAAGLAGGDKAFWGMHHWLVERGGQFSQADLRSRLDQLGVDADDFGKAFNDPTVDSLVRADIEEGMAFGLTFTPLVFVNGYRVDGWQSAGVLPAAIERAAEVSKRQPRRNDRPDLALDIQFRNWLATPAVPIPLRADEQSRGPINARITILVYGDLTCAFHASARDIFDGFLNQYPDVRYVFRDFPLDANCNQLVKQQINPRACEVSRWAIAVGQLAGDSSYWKAHDWILRNRDHLENVTVANLGLLVGLKPEDILHAATLPAVEGALQANLTLAIQMGVTMSPTIYVNGKIVSGWRTPGVLSRVISAATSGRE
jgi:protein-disulfide isomerase/uncharacterized membrane protein